MDQLLWQLWVYLKMKIQCPRFASHVEQVLKMDCGAYYLSKENQGNDAHFICVEEQTIGVADGVGGWKKWGVDAGEYSRELMRNSKRSVHNQHRDGQEIDPIGVLEEAYTNTKHIKLGSSTACIVTLKNTKGGSGKATLHAANIGDSGFKVFRKNHNSRYKLQGQSLTLQRRFNCPYQLGNVDKSDDPDLADEFKFTNLIEAGDVIVVATDGLFDNVFPDRIGNIMDCHDFETQKPEELAKKIGIYAAHMSHDKSCNTPFAEAARKAGLYHVGGKVDDITVVVGVVHSKTRLVSKWILEW